MKPLAKAKQVPPMQSLDAELERILKSKKLDKWQRDFLMDMRKRISEGKTITQPMLSSIADIISKQHAA